MPVCLEPNQKFFVVLECDKDKTPRPTFWVKSQSMRGQLQVLDLLGQLNTETTLTASQLFETTIAKLKEVVIGWENMGRDFSPEAFEEILTYHEARELLRKVAYNLHYADPDEKKE